MGLFLQFAVLAVAKWDVVAAVSQVNISMCNWAQLRANVIRDTIYLEGGSLWWLPYVFFRVYTLNLTMPFDQTTNLTFLFKPMSRATTYNISLTDGAMFVNDNEFILYGGLIVSQDGHSPAANWTLGYEQDQEGLESINWMPNFIQNSLPDGLTRYTTNGGAISAPSENLGFYFSGVHGQSGRAIADEIERSTDVIASTLITVNMSTMGNQTWSNNTLPDNIPGRINAELAWIPVSQSGVLIAIGGVLYSDAVTIRELTAAQALASNQTSPTFMQTVPVYDISNNQWYMQQTSGDIPPQLTLFCSVVAAAADNSSYNIYIYRGYDGINSNQSTSDDVYVLSIPSFTWVKVYSGTSTHGRSGHKCVKVHPDQMFVLGGIVPVWEATTCLEGGIIQVLNLNTLKFQDSYSPTTWSEYNVPSLVTAQIGGNEKGGATKRAPENWTTSLATVFQSKYQGTITTYYPYSPVSNTTSTTSPSIVPSPSNPGGGSKIPTWLGAVIAVILGVVIGILILVVWFFCRRSKRPRTKCTGMVSEAEF
ncbi:hypothetical protein V8E54_008390 [Elaphomyces granulatus]